MPLPATADRHGPKPPRALLCCERGTVDDAAIGVANTGRARGAWTRAVRDRHGPPGYDAAPTGFGAALRAASRTIPRAMARITVAISRPSIKSMIDFGPSSPMSVA